MAKKITYLLGAGASANTIPVVAFMHKRMEEIIRFLKSCLPAPAIIIKPVEIPVDKLDTLKEIISDLDWLVEQAGNYYTIDTLAKKFYLTDDNKNLKRLKKCLIIYFTIEQFLFIKNDVTENSNTTFNKEPTDKRYSSFLAAITRKLYRLPGTNPNALAYENLPFELNPNIKILSWNYDVQFELSVQSFLTKTIIQHIKSEFLILPNNNSKNEVNKLLINSNRFGMVKLNGDAIWNRLFQQDYKYTIFDGKNENELLIDFLEGYKTGNIERGVSNSTDISPLNCFNFAWEKDNNFRDKYQGHSKNLENAELIASETEILIVIGYSFPIFNREVDNNLLKKMVKLEKVYIQDREPEKIKSTMQNAFEILQAKKTVNSFGNETTVTALPAGELRQVDKVTFQLEENTNQFIIPYELSR